jgi:hypothetical protein
MLSHAFYNYDATEGIIPLERGDDAFLLRACDWASKTNISKSLR